ncbi:MAG TPA: hypothetical protein VK166_14060 [Chitinophagaceae bacterium]|nr:hypothetical protein [Chitinophagaceae bacterium]
MIHSNTKNIAPRSALVLFSLVMLTMLNSCAKKVSFQTSTVVPAAEGSVKLTKDNNHNYGIKIYLANLAEPTRLQPSKSSYVVWMETDENSTKNIGQINTSTGFMSSKLKASFETVSPVKPTKIFITAEDEPGVQYPGTQVVLTTQAF